MIAPVEKLAYPQPPKSMGTATPGVARKKWWNITLRVCVTLFLFAVLFKSISLSGLILALTRVQPLIVLLGLAFGALGTVVSAYQWQVILDAQGIHVALLRLIKLYLVGVGFSHFLPTGMGGDIVKAYYVGRDSGKGAASTSAVIMARITGFLGMLLVAWPVFVLWRGHFTLDVGIWFALLSLGMFAVIVGAVCAAHLLSSLQKEGLTERRVLRILAPVIKVGNAIKLSGTHPRSLWAATLIGLIFWVVACLNYYTYAAAQHIYAPLYLYFVAIPLVSLVTFLPISINGFGVRESVFVSIFTTFNVPAASSLLLIILMDIQVLLYGIIGGCLYLMMGSRWVKKVQQGMMRGQDEYS